MFDRNFSQQIWGPDQNLSGAVVFPVCWNENLTILSCVFLKMKIFHEKV
jgi:hypothetical protein